MLRAFDLRTDHNARSLWLLLRNNWRALAGDGKPLSVTVQEHKEKRSSDQNRRYWAILNETERQRSEFSGAAASAATSG